MSKSKLRIGTWNVRSLLAAGKLANTVKEMRRMKIDILGLSETRWPDSGTCNYDGTTMYCIGGSHKDRHPSGVAVVIVSESVGKTISGV